MAIQEIRIPDIGGATDVDVIEVCVAVGDDISAEAALVTLEGDKATMDIPAPVAGKVTALQVSVGDKVSEGDVILSVDVAGSAETAGEAPDEAPAPSAAETAPAPVAAEAPSAPQVQPVVIPDIGGATDVDIIELNVAAGDEVEKDDALLTLEGDKATMDIPAPFAGKVESVAVSVGDKVSAGDLILNLLTTGAAAAPADSQASAPAAPAPARAPEDKAAPAQPTVSRAPSSDVHAGPSVRRLARELGVDLTKVPATGRKGRIMKEDVKRFVKGVMQGGGAPAGSGLPQAPEVDFSRFGETETKALTKIKKLTGVNLHRNWVLVPHVTQVEEADITEMEAFRKSKKAEAEQQGFKLTPLVFIMKAVEKALRQFPQFNASLDPSGENLILKKYFNIGVAVDTPNGLVVPVIRDVNKKSIYDLAKELGAMSQKAREKGLSVQEMQGGCFTISSLGGIGGTQFTPIVNMPEVAILGLSRSQMKPVYQDGEFVPRLMLPMSLSYDHRVIDGAEGARFAVYLSQCLADIRNLIL